MRIPFTKMQGAGNDFVVLDETRQSFHLQAAHYRFLANRQFGVGADQILTVRPATVAGADFQYVIHNADGSEVEHCGNGARCFVRYVVEQGLTAKTTIQVQIQKGLIELKLTDDGQVTVNMGAPIFDSTRIPFNPQHATPVPQNDWCQWLLHDLPVGFDAAQHLVSTLSMGNPHAVVRVASVETAPVLALGSAIEQHAAFPNKVNVGFMEVVSPSHIKLRVFERGSGETLSCGTGACAAVVSGIRHGWLQGPVQVQTLGGHLHIDWTPSPDLQNPVLMTGPATTVFHGEIILPNPLA
jgi:diaminopimelate epimerase